MSETNKIFDRGSAVVIEVTITEAAPFGDNSALDPATVKVTVIDQAGTEKVIAADMTKHAAGQYYYVCQTLANWAAGWYTAKIVSTSGIGNDVTTDPQAFYLR